MSQLRTFVIVLAAALTAGCYTHGANRGSRASELAVEWEPGVYLATGRIRVIDHWRARRTYRYEAQVLMGETGPLEAATEDGACLQIGAAGEFRCGRATFHIQTGPEGLYGTVAEIFTVLRWQRRCSRCPRNDRVLVERDLVHRGVLSFERVEDGG